MVGLFETVGILVGFSLIFWIGSVSVHSRSHFGSVLGFLVPVIFGWLELYLFETVAYEEALFHYMEHQLLVWLALIGCMCIIYFDARRRFVNQY